MYEDLAEAIRKHVEERKTKVKRIIYKTKKPKKKEQYFLELVRLLWYQAKDAYYSFRRWIGR